MADFNFNPGLMDQGALAQMLQASVQGAQAAAQLRTMGMGQAVDSAIQGVNAGLNRRLGRQESEAERALRQLLADQAIAAETSRQSGYQEFQAGEAEKARQFSADQAGLDRSLNEQQFEQGQRGSFLREMAGAGAQQGYPAPALLERGMNMLPGGQQGFGQSGVGIPPGGPGGYMIGQEGGSGYQRLMREGGGGLFDGLQPMPQAEPIEAQKFRLSEQQKQQVGQAALQIRRLQAQQDKGVVVQEETSLADALGMGSLDDVELEAAVIQAWPTLAPKKDLEGKEGDRRALDAKIKQLTKKQKVSIPNGAGLTGLDWSSVGNDPAIIHAAMEEVYGQAYDLPMTPEEFRAAANRKLLGQFPEYAMKFQPAQLQGGGDLLDALNGKVDRTLDEDRVSGATRTPGPAQFNKGLLERSNIVFDQLDRSLQDAAMSGFEIGPGKSGAIEFMPRQDGSTASPKMQAALKKLLDDPKKGRELRAVLGIGADVKLSPSEVEKAGATRQVLGADQKVSPAPAKPPAATKSGGQGAPNEQPGSAPPPAPRRSAVEEWNASRQKAAAPAQKKAAPKIPPSTSLVGLPESVIMRLLLGGPR